MTPQETTDIDPREALAEGTDQTIEETSESSSAPEKPEVDVIDVIEPQVEPKQWVLEDDKGNRREYVQKPLSYFDKMQFFSLVGEVIDKAVSGENGLRIGSLFDVPGGRGGTLSAEDFRDADTFVQAVGKLLTYAPDLLQKCYCIWWKIPEFEREWAIEVMSQSPEDGGLSDEQGVKVIEIFIDQNWEALEGFFREQLPRVRKRVQAHRQKPEEASAPSKPSNGTPLPTQSQ